MRDDTASPETAPARQVTSSASVQYEVGGFSRVRDRQSAFVEANPPAVIRPKTDADIAAEAGLAMHDRLREQQAREDAKRVDVYQKRIADARAAAAAEDARKRKAQHDFAENAVLHECSDLSPAEQQMFWNRLVAMNCCLDVSAAAIVAEDIRASRVQEER